MWTLLGYLEFEIIRPTWTNKTHITISYERLKQDRADRLTLGSSSPPRPHEAEGTKLKLEPPRGNLPLRKTGKLATWLVKVILSNTEIMSHSIGVVSVRHPRMPMSSMVGEI